MNPSLTFFFPLFLLLLRRRRGKEGTLKKRQSHKSACASPFSSGGAETWYWIFVSLPVSSSSSTSRVVFSDTDADD